MPAIQHTLDRIAGAVTLGAPIDDELADLRELLRGRSAAPALIDALAELARVARAIFARS